METFFNRYLWLVLLAALAGGAFLVASGANHLGAAAFLQPTAAPLIMEEEAREEVGRDDRGKSIIARNVFDPSATAPPPEDDPDDEAGDTAASVEDLGDQGELGEHVPLSELSVTVTGTVVSTIPSSSNASIQEARETKLYFEGDKLKDATVYAIRRKAVYVVRASKLERLPLGGKAAAGKGSTSTSPPKRNPLTSSKRSSGRSGTSGKEAMARIRDGIKKVGRDEYEIDRGMLEEQLQDLNKLGSQARIIPHYKDGRADGFKLVGIRPGSLYTHLGVRSGDVIQRVNGEEMNSPTKALALYEKLRTTGQVSVDVLRRGKPKTLTFNIK